MRGLPALTYREGNIIDLRDATQAELMSAFGNERSPEGKLWRFVRPGRSHVTVFYSGHGVPGLKDKRGYCCRSMPTRTRRRSTAIRWTFCTRTWPHWRPRPSPSIWMPVFPARATRAC